MVPAPPCSSTPRRTSPPPAPRPPAPATRPTSITPRRRLGPGSFIQHNYSWRDVVSYVRGNHNFTFGVQAEHGDDSANFGPPQARPQFAFNTLTDFVQDKVYSEGNITYDPLTGKFKPLQFGDQGTSFGVYAQDQWKLRDNVTLTLGLRWDDFGNPTTYGYQSYINFANVQLAGNSTHPDFTSLNAQFANASIKQTNNANPSRQNLNFTPRLAFAWQPYRSSPISVHGGAGLYRDPITLGQVIDGLRTNPPGWITPYFAPAQPIQPIYSFGSSTVAPYGYVYPSIPATGLDERGGVPGAAAPITGLDPHIRIPKTLNYTIGVSTQLAGKMVLGINGVGSHAYDQLSGTDFNRFAGDLLVNNGKLQRLNPSFGSVTYVSNLNTANYFGLVVTATQHLRSFDYQASYTWSKSTDYGTCGTADALALSIQLLHTHPSDGQLWLDRGLAEIGLDRTAAAEQSLRHALTVSPDLLPAAQAGAQIAYTAHTPAASAFLADVLRLDPASAPAHAMLGVLALEAHHCPDALNHFRQAGDLAQ